MNPALPGPVRRRSTRLVGRIAVAVVAVTSGLAATAAVASAAPPAPRPALPSPGVLEVRDFVAFVNAQPPGPRRLIVTGTVVVAHQGYQVRLVPGRSDVPGVLVLDLVVRRLPGRYVPLPTERDVRFESTTGIDVETVVIRPVGLELPVSTAW